MPVPLFDFFDFEEAVQLADARGVAHFAEGLGFDLADAFAGHFELLADLFERARVTIHEAEALFEHFALALVQAAEHVAQFVLEQAEAGHLGRILGGFVFDEVAEIGVFAVANGRLEGNRLLRHFDDGADAVDGQLHFVGDFLRCGFAAEILQQPFLGAHEFVDRFDHVHRDADGAGLVGNGAGDGLADPPGGVGGKFIAAAVLEFFDGFHQAHVAFLDEIKEGQAAVGVFFGDGNDEAKVGFDHFGFGLERLDGIDLQEIVGFEILLAGHADEFLERADLALLGFNDDGGLRGFAVGFELLDGAEAEIDFVVDVFRDEGHFLDDFLFVEKFIVGFLQLLIGFLKGGVELGGGGFGRGALPFGVKLVDVLVELADVADQAAQFAQVGVAAVDFLVENDAVKAFLGRLGNQFFRKGDVFLAGETEAVDDIFDFVFGVLDALGDFDFLFACEERHLAHLLEIHADRIIENVEAGFILLFLGLGLFDAVDFGLVDDFDFEVAELDVNFVEFLAGDHGVREGFVDVVVGEVALLLGEADKFFDLFGDFSGAIG